MLGWLRSILAGKERRASKASPPTEGEALPRDEQIASRWGGFFFGAAGETVPVCQGTGRPMRPLVQIRMDELPEIPACFRASCFSTYESI